MSKHYVRNRRLMWILFAVLVVLHHDWWFWNDGRLMFGFLPIGLGYQIVISIAAGLLWGWAALYAWPDEIVEAIADEPAETSLSHAH